MRTCDAAFCIIHLNKEFVGLPLVCTSPSGILSTARRFHSDVAKRFLPAGRPSIDPALLNIHTSHRRQD
eukprot:scaffold2751_cov131-Cylindrotheca_fusiformis.AAC.26